MMKLKKYYEKFKTILSYYFISNFSCRCRELCISKIQNP